MFINPNNLPTKLLKHTLPLCSVNIHLSSLATDKHIREIARNITHRNILWEDLIHEVLVIIHDMGDEVITGLVDRQQLRPMFVATMYYQWNNSYNQFNKKYEHLLQKQPLSPFTAYPESVEPPMWVTSGDVVDCLGYFDTATPERIKISRHLKRIEREAIDQKRFPYQVRLIEMYRRYPSLRKLEKATRINYAAIKRDLDKIIKEIKDIENPA